MQAFSVEQIGMDDDFQIVIKLKKSISCDYGFVFKNRATVFHSLYLHLEMMRNEVSI